jgi:hypothetical protein
LDEARPISIASKLFMSIMYLFQSVAM